MNKKFKQLSNKFNNNKIVNENMSCEYHNHRINPQ